MVKHFPADKEARHHLRRGSHFLCIPSPFHSFKTEAPRKNFQNDHFFFHSEI